MLELGRQEGLKHPWAVMPVWVRVPFPVLISKDLYMKLHLNQYNCCDWEDLCLPEHRSMRSSVNRHSKRLKYQYGYHYRDHYNRDFYKWVDNFLEKSIGKDFKYVFEKIREKFSPAIHSGFWTSPLELLHGYVDEYEEIPNSYWANSYYFDNDRILRKRKRTRRSKFVKVTKLRPTSFYKIANSNWRVNTYICGRIGYKRYRHIMDSGGYINKALAIKLRFELASKGIKPDDYISPVYECDSYTCERGSKECSRYFAEQAKMQRKLERERENKRKEENRWILYKIEAKRKEREEQLNIITRDRLGFNEDSFKGEFYHGQKRKRKNKIQPKVVRASEGNSM